MTVVRFAPPAIGTEDIEAVLAVLASGWLTTGPKTAEFEREFADRIGCRHAVGVSSCTAGLQLAMQALGIGSGDKVATSAMTFTATAEAIVNCGAQVVLVDIDADTLTIDPQALERALTDQPDIRAVIPVHYGGQACDMQSIENICRPRGVLIIEDAAHAFPTRHRGRMVGTIGDATVFSFYANKNITAGEGGLVATADAALAERMREMRLHGIRKPDLQDGQSLPWQYDVVRAGSKCNMSDLSAALALAQLRQADAFQARRRRNAELYGELLSGLPLAPLRIDGEPGDHAWHLYVIRLDETRARIGRNALSAAMRAAAVETSVHYKPVHLHSHWQRSLRLPAGALPVAENAYRSILSLPMHPLLTDDDIARVSRLIMELV